VIPVLDLLAALGAIGVDTDALYRAADLTPDKLRDPAAHLPAEVVLTLLAEAERRTGDPLIGLHAGEHAEARGPLAYLLLATPRLEDGIRQMEQFSQLVVHDLRLRLERGPHAAGVCVELGQTLGRSAHTVDYVLMVLAYLLQAAVGRGFRLLGVHVRHAPLGDAREPLRAFGCPVAYGQSDDRVVFPSRFLDARSRGAGPLVREQIEKFTATLLDEVTPHETFQARVADVARSLLGTGRRADRAAVAHRLHTSQRTMQRRLEEENTSFTRVRDGVLWEVVDSLMSNPELKVEAVALSVGFRHVSAFSKAFKRHTGVSPTEYRQRAGHARRRVRRLTRVGAIPAPRRV
jgi:AraC-like DNA-binding protein